MQAAERAENVVFVPGDLDIETRRSKRPNVVSVNLAHIRSAAPEIFHTRTKNSQTVPKNRTLLGSLHAVTMIT